ncbi:MAG: hypothetical protein AVDCRST_MAG32-3036, partial [uncultured Nocardioides sp.]
GQAVHHRQGDRCRGAREGRRLEAPHHRRPAGVARLRRLRAPAGRGCPADRAGRQQPQRPDLLRAAGSGRRRPRCLRAQRRRLRLQGSGGRGQERAGQLGPRCGGLAGGRPDPRPHHPAL